MRKILSVIISLVLVCTTLGFVKSEVKADTIGTAEIYVSNLYNVCMGREPDQEGFDFYVNALYDGKMSATEVAASFFFSDEYRAFNKSNERYVADLYRALLGREYDSIGYVFLLDMFNMNYICIYSTDCAIFNGFTMSEEFKAVCDELDLEVGEMYITNERARIDLFGQPDKNIIC